MSTTLYAPTTTITNTMQNLGEGTSAQNVPAVSASTAATMASSASAVTTAAATLSTASKPTVMMMAMAGYDATLAPPPFHGSAEDDGEGWLARFEKYVVYRGFPETEKLNLLAVPFRDQAAN